MVLLKVQRIDESLPLPEYQTEGSVAFDFYTRIDADIQAKQHLVIPSNLIIEVPKGFFLMIAARSSLLKKGLMLGNGVGVIDQDYHGPKDEIGILVYNQSAGVVEVKRGDRIAQGLIIPIERVGWEEVREINKPSRGGFGSTG